MYNTLQSKYPNLYILLITIAVGIWFRIIGNTLDIFAPKKGILYYYIVVGFLALAFLYFNDLSLNELHDVDPSAAGAVGGLGAAAYEAAK